MTIRCFSNRLEYASGFDSRSQTTAEVAGDQVIAAAHMEALINKSTNAVRAVNPPEKFRAAQALWSHSANLAEKRGQERVELKDAAGVAQGIDFAWPLTSGNCV